MRTTSRTLVTGVFALLALLASTGCGEGKTHSPQQAQHFEENRKREQAEDAAATP